MVNYKNGKIYKLVNSVAVEGNCYYGSTCNELRYRKKGHKNNYNQWKNGKFRYVTSFELFEQDYENIDIILLENYPCNSKYELHSRERVWIESNRCLNKFIPNRTPKEYYEQNKDKYKEYIQKNKEEIEEYQNEYRTKNKKK